jgi:D-3-phosphoglycerate dehydrogenase / 2-oxoglutarate reductase
MRWQVLCAAHPESIPNADLSIEAAQLATVDVEVMTTLITSQAEVAEAGPSADGLITLGIGLGRETLARLTNCRAIISVSHGFNHLDLAAATEMGIPVANTYFCHQDVANHTVMLLLACARKLTLLHEELSAGRWRRDLLVNIPPIYGQTLGLIGFGHIGSAVARRGQALGMDVIASDPYVDSRTLLDAGVGAVGPEEVLRRSDFVSLHLPLSDETHHLIGEAELRAMRPSAFLLNTARGGLVDEAALIRALREGWIAGAGLDVFEQEPTDSTNPLLTLPNVVHTPHSAGTSNASLPNGRRQAAAALALALRGIWPPHVVNPEVRGATRFPFAEPEEAHAAHA